MTRFVGDSGTICFYCNNFTYHHSGLVCGQRYCIFNRAECLGLRLTPCRIFCTKCLSGDQPRGTAFEKKKMLEVILWKAKD